MSQLIERRTNAAQRHAVEETLATASGTIALLRADDGSVFVYDEHRDWRPPTTLRIRITATGEVEEPDRLRLSAG